MISGILRSATATPIKAMESIAPRENRTKIHFILPIYVNLQKNSEKNYYFNLACVIITQLWSRKKNMEWKYDKIT